MKTWFRVITIWVILLKQAEQMPPRHIRGKETTRRRKKKKWGVNFLSLLYTKKKKKRMKKKEKKSCSIINSHLYGIGWKTFIVGRCWWWNRRWERWFGWPPNAILWCGCCGTISTVMALMHRLRWRLCRWNVGI